MTLLSVFAFSSLMSTVTAQTRPQLTAPNVNANGELTGYAPTQGSIVVGKIKRSASGGPCGKYVSAAIPREDKKAWKVGRNNPGTPKEFTIAIGTARVTAKTSSPAYVDSRYVAFREAWIDANAKLAGELEKQIASEAVNTLRSSSGERTKSPAERAASLRKEAAAIDAQSGAKIIGGGKEVVSRGIRWLNAALAEELKSKGHDVEAEQKALNEQNAARKKELLAKAKAAERAAKNIVGQRKFKEMIKAMATERMKGTYAAFANENLSPDGANTQICVALRYSPKSERLADMMARRDFTNPPRVKISSPIMEQLPDPGTPEGVFQLVTKWGLNVLFDENRHVNLVAFGQAGYREGDQNSELAARVEARLRAEGMIRLFINQVVKVQEAADLAQNVRSYTNALNDAVLTKNTMREVSQKGGGFRPINGLREIIGWNGIHPVTNAGIAGSVVSWNASEAAGAIVSKSRQNKRVRDLGGAAINRGNDRSSQEAPKRNAGSSKEALPRKGGLSGSTRSQNF